MAESEERPGTIAAVSVQERTIRTLLSLIEDLTVEGEEAGLLRSTLAHAVTALGLTGGITFVLSTEGEIVAAATHGPPPAEVDAARELAREALEWGRPVVREMAGGGWVAAAPLGAKHRKLGVLALHAAQAGEPPPAPALMEALGKQIGTGLFNARLFAELRAASSRTEVLNRISRTLTSSLDLQAVIPAFAQEMAALQPFDRLACAFVNDSGDYIEVATHPESTTWGLGEVVPVVGSGPGSVVLNDRAVLQRDLLHDHRFIEDMRLLEDGIRSYVLLPLRARGRCIGVLALGSSQDGAYDEATLARMQPLADSVALALENVRLFQKTRELSITDEVTPLYNVRFFHQILDRELKLSDRYGFPLSLVFVDLDRFKPINDQYGHLRGSRVLREVGFLLRAIVRETDYPARYGGDEFVVVLPQTDREAAVTVGEKIRTSLEEHVFLQEEGINARLGASLGIATYPHEARSKEALIRTADERMYADKDTRKAR